MWMLHDMERYKDYINANGPVFAEYGARFLVRGGHREVREGPASVPAPW